SVGRGKPIRVSRGGAGPPPRTRPGPPPRRGGGARRATDPSPRHPRRPPRCPSRRIEPTRTPRERSPSVMTTPTQDSPRRRRAAIIGLGLDGPLRPHRLSTGQDCLLIGGTEQTHQALLET